MSQPKEDDTVYIIGKIGKIFPPTGNQRLACRVKTKNEDGIEDSFAIYIDQIALVETPEEVENADA